MKTVTLEVASREDITRRALDAFRGKKQRNGNLSLRGSPRRISLMETARCDPMVLWI